MKRADYGDVEGICEVCGINLWSSVEGKPVVWPCNIGGCPYELADEQNRKIRLDSFSSTGSGLGQIDF